MKSLRNIANKNTAKYSLCVQLISVGTNFGRFLGRFSLRKHNTISEMNYNLGRFTFLPIFFRIIMKKTYVYGVHNTENCKKSDFSPFGNTKMPCNELVLNLFASIDRNNKL